MGSQSARSMEIFRERGWFVEKVEQVVHGTFIKRDCFGFLDLICVRAGDKGVTGVQVCASDRKADHVAKAQRLEAIWTWLRCGNRIAIHSWRKRSSRHAVTKKWGQKRWAVVEMFLSLEDLQPEPDWTVVRAELEREAALKRIASNEKRKATILRKKALKVVAL